MSLFFLACHNPQKYSLKPGVVIFHRTASPLQLAYLDIKLPTHCTNSLSADTGGGEGTTVFIQNHYENQQTSFSSFVSDTCANSFVFLFGRRKGGSQEHTPCFKQEREVYRHL